MPAKNAANMIKGAISRLVKERNLEPEDAPITGAQLYELYKFLDAGTISHTIAEQVMDALFDQPGASPAAIIEERGLVQNSNKDEILALCKQAIEANPKAVADYAAGKKKALTALVGFVMKQTKGKANPKLVNQLLASLLNQ